MPALIRHNAPALAALAFMLTLAGTASPVHASTLMTQADMNQIFSSAGAGDISFFSWGKILGFVVYLVLPLLAILGAAWCINNIRDNPQPGNVISNAIAIAFMLGVTLVCAAIPGRIQAAQQTNGANGAMLPSIALSVSHR